MAVSERFELSLGINLNTLSRRAPSATQPAHQLILFMCLIITIAESTYAANGALLYAKALSASSVFVTSSSVCILASHI